VSVSTVRSAGSQEGLADLVGLHWTFVGQVERGRRNLTLHNILKLAAALDIDALSSKRATPANVAIKPRHICSQPAGIVSRQGRTVGCRAARGAWGNESCLWDDARTVQPLWRMSSAVQPVARVYTA
jgi:transcriptional regulator with XRE-family HTH domain